MSWTAAQIPDQTGRVAVVTGGNGGLGLETARALAGKGAHVIMAARNQDKATAAEADIRAEIPDASVEVRRLDLSSLTSIRSFAERVIGERPRIDLLINNAGVMGIPERHTEDGFEMQFVSTIWGISLSRLCCSPRYSVPTPPGSSTSPAQEGTPGGRWIPPTRTCGAATPRGGRTGSPSWPTSDSRSASNSAFRRRAPERPA